jgi:hypothetical protein
MNKQQALRAIIGGADGFVLGAGALKARPGAYQLATNWDGRFGIPGPREVADLTGIAATFRVIKILKHADTNVAITTDGTSTRVYRKETTWVAKVKNIDGGGDSVDAITGAATDAISFKNVLAIARGSGAAYVYTSATTTSGANTWEFTTSTKTAGNAERANYFLEQSNGLLTPRVSYCTNPNEVYYTEDLTNTDATGVNPSYIGDTSTTQTYFTSIAEEPATGRVLYGMRHALYTLHTEPGFEGVVERLTEQFPDPISDAGGQSDRLNFEAPALVGGTLYYPVEGRDILAWQGGQYDRYMAPRWVNDCKLPRFDLPINALCSAGGYLIAFLGSKNTATLKTVTYFSGGNAHLAGQFTTASEMWVGVPAGGRMVWHGILLECTNPLRGAFYDEDDGYLTLFSGDSESADVQTTRCLFPLDNPINRLTSSNVVLNAGTWKLEPGGVDFGDEWQSKRAEHIRVMALGLATTAPTIEVEYKVTPDYDTTAFETAFAVFDDEAGALLGAAFPDETIGQTVHLRFVGGGTGNAYAVLRAAELRATWASELDEQARRR